MPKIDSYPRITSPQNNDLLLISDQSEEFDSKSITLSQISGVVNSGKQNQITLTTIGTTGPATFVGDVLNIPNYAPSGGGGSGTITNIATTAPITGGPINQNGTIGITQASLSTDGYLSSTDFTTFNNKQSTSEKGAASGYAPLDANQKVPSANLPDSIVGAVSYQGTWDAQNNNPALPNPTTVQGHYYVTEVPGTYLGNVYSVGDWVISNGTIWEKVDNTQNVNSVFGRTGNVVADAGDYSTFYLGINDGYTNADVDAHLNNDGSVANNSLLSWNGTDYAWVSQGTQGFVTSVNNQTGQVTLTTDNITQGTSNLYFPGFGTTATTALAGNTALNTAGDMATTGSVNLSTESLEFDGVNGIITYAGSAAGGNNKIQIDGGNLVPRNGTSGMVTGYTPTNALDVATKAYVDAQSGGSGVTSIIAGTNVTISPVSGTGDVTINASGGGSGGSYTTLSVEFSGNVLVNAFNGNLSDAITLVTVPANNFAKILEVTGVTYGATSGTTNYNSNNSLYVKRVGSITGGSFSAPSLIGSFINASSDQLTNSNGQPVGAQVNALSTYGGLGADIVLGPSTTGPVTISQGDRTIRLSIVYRLINFS